MINDWGFLAFKFPPDGWAFGATVSVQRECFDVGFNMRLGKLLDSEVW